MDKFWKYGICFSMLIPLIFAWGKYKNKHLKDCPYEDEETHECCHTKSVNRTLPFPIVMKCSEIPSTTPAIDNGNDNNTQQHLDSENDGGDEKSKERCLVFLMLTFNVTYGIKNCCEGWKEDYYGDCTIKSDASTNIFCLNGGQVSEDSKSCNCPEGFEGDSCENAICNPPCMNQGECGAEEGKPVCVCYGGRFTGKQCETPVCPSPCQNGGECKQFGVTTECLCTPEYEGPACEYPIKLGTCPVTAAHTSNCYSECDYDSDCGGKKKCCFNGCGRSCQEPVSKECSYKGSIYQVGESFKDGNCKSCTCLHPGENGVQCTDHVCPQIQCTDLQQTPDGCCPVCKDQGEPLGTGPKFKDCPSNVTVYIQPNSRTANLDLSSSLQIKAVDSNNEEYNPHFSVQHLESCSCNDTRQNLHHVVATSGTDKYGRFDTCTFSAEVKDPYPPKFLSCPSPKQALFDERITWNTPEVTDNVGVQSLTLVTAHVNNTLFGTGEYVVVYIAKDFDGNEAICRFLVQVYHPSSKYLPPSLLARQNEQNNYTVLAALVAIIGCLVILVSAVSYLFRRRQQSSHPSNTEEIDLENSAPPPSYDCIEKDSLPQYSAISPPVYEQTDAVAMTTKNGVENPIYTVTEENEDVMETKVPTEDSEKK